MMYPLPVQTDVEQLIAKAQAGDQAAIQTLCSRLYPSVQRMVHQSLATDIRYKRPWLGAMFSTGDVVQEVFLGVLRDLTDIKGRTESELLGYIATLTKNRLIDSIRFYEASRRDRRRVESAAENPLDETPRKDPSPEEIAIGQEQALRFQRALNSFTERDRGLLRERIENKTSFAEIASLLGFASADSARKSFHVAQARLLLRLRSPHE